MTSDSVRQAGAAPDLNHRDPEYAVLIRETKERLLSVYDQTTSGWEPYLLGGSGTLAVEAMITSVIGAGPVLILENGYYSGRIRDIFDVHAIPYKSLTSDWLDAWGFDEIRRELSNGYEAVIGTHNETTTGRLNDIARLGSLCREFGVKCLVDAMSSFGADSIDFSNLDAVCASGNKCLHSIPGVAFVLVNSSSVGGMANVPRRSYYMSLPMYTGDNPPLTPPVPGLMALREALREMGDGGAKARQADYALKAKMLRSNLARKGLMSPIPVADLSCTLTTVNLPQGFTYDQWFQLNSEAGYILYGCKGVLKDKYFQVSNMGNLTIEQLESWIGVISDFV